MDALGDVATYTYSSGLLQSVTDPFNHTTTFGYDADRRLTTVTDALNHTSTISYDSNGNVQSVTDPLSRVSTYSYDVMDRLTGTVNALGGRTTITWDSSGLELTSTDELGVKASLVYDGYQRGLPVGVVQGAGSGEQVTALTSYDAAKRVTGTRDELGAWTTMLYDAVGRLTESVDGVGGVTQFDHDHAEQVTAVRDAAGRWTTYAYNTRGWVTQQTDNAGNSSSFGYDLAGNLTTSTDPLNHTVTYAYDVLNRQTTLTDPLNHTTTTAYDAVGNVSSITDPNGHTTSFTYDALERQTAETDAVGTSVQRTTSVAYDAVGNVTGSTDGRGHATALAYDGLDRVTTVTDPLSHTTTLAYDAAGDLTTNTDPLGKVVTYGYDTLHREVAVTDPLGHTTTSILDAAGDVAASVDALGNVSQAILDPLGRAVGGVDALGYVTQVSLDPTGGTRMVLDPVGNETHYVLDSAGRQAGTIDPQGNRTTLAYDAASRLTNVTDRDGRQIQYSFDNADRKTGEVWKSAAGATVNVVTYSYDSNDNLTSAADSNGTLTYSFDERDRTKSFTNVFGQVLTYSYDGNDNVTLRTDSLGGTLTSVYDNADRLTSRQFSGTGPTGTVVRVDFGYDNRDEQTSITRYSDLAGTNVIATTVYSYDDAGRLTGMVNKDTSAATLSYYNYGFDNADRVTSQTWWSKVGTVSYSGTNTYSYDATSQLTNDSSATYSYDGNGNRTMAGYQTGSGNRMTNDGTYTYTYDAEGNVTEKSKGTGLEHWYFTWDNTNRLTNVRKTSDGTTNTQLVTYTYDVAGDLVQQDKWVTGGSTVTTRYAYDGANVWADLDGSNNLLVRYVFGDAPDQILTRTVGSGPNAGVAVYFTDLLGSVRDLANASGVVQDHIDYDGYGKPAEVNAAYGDRFGYTGRWYDASTGLENDRGRWYAAASGKWLSQDPILFMAGDPNLYRYVQNSPTNGTDPSGLVPDNPDANPSGNVAPRISVNDVVKSGTPQKQSWADWLAYGPAWLIDKTTVGVGTDFITSPAYGAYIDFNDRLFAGWGAGLLGDNMLRARETLWGETATRNHSGPVYTAGTYIGRVHNLALLFASGWSIFKGLKNIGSGVQITRGAFQTVGGPPVRGWISFTVTNPAVITEGQAAVASGARGLLAGGLSMAATPSGNPQRPFGDLVKDAQANPSKWQVIKKEVVDSTNARNKGGTSVQELLRNTETGEEIVRHTLLKPDGKVFEPSHFRPFWK